MPPPEWNQHKKQTTSTIETPLLPSPPPPWLLTCWSLVKDVSIIAIVSWMRWSIPWGRPGCADFCLQGAKIKRKSWGISLIVLHVSIPASESLTSFSHGGPFFLSTVHSNESGEVPFPWSRRTKKKTEHNGQVWDRRRCCCPMLRTTEAEEQHMIFFLPFQFFRHCFLTRHKMQHDAVGTFLQLLGLCFGVF